MTNTVFLAVGPFCWGRADTVAAALKNAKANFPGSSYARHYKPGEPCYTVYEVHPDSYVGDLGGITYPRDHKPKEVGKFDLRLKEVVK